MDDLGVPPFMETPISKMFWWFVYEAWPACIARLGLLKDLAKKALDLLTTQIRPETKLKGTDG